MPCFKKFDLGPLVPIFRCRDFLRIELDVRASTRILETSDDKVGRRITCQRENDGKITIIDQRWFVETINDENGEEESWNEYDTVIYFNCLWDSIEYPIVQPPLDIMRQIMDQTSIDVEDEGVQMRMILSTEGFEYPPQNHTN